MAVVLGRKHRALLRTIGKANSPGFTPTRLVAKSSERQDIGKRWLCKLLVRKLEPTKESHSRMLSDKGIIYALSTHNIRPDSVDKYLANYEQYVNLIHSKKPELNCELIGSWMVEVGDLDQAFHLWQYTGGFEPIDRAQAVLGKDESHQKLVKEQGNYLRSRHLQHLLAFSYWPQPKSRSGSNKYEIRSYTLKPGTMIEWGNNWARAINYRRNNDEAFAGFFSQIGRLYNVHHIWCFKDLQARKEIRENAWRTPGWDKCVEYTVPLIREMHSHILNPTSFSPTK
ncbi:protein NipSnap [Orussus abietinus]|uniref:protein NipSnap n=1 Tax=Orussus abietinus TaxID=222816 RepID=UPI000625FD7D|nr:protein NipSnap [Orussus abietinus]